MKAPMPAAPPPDGSNAAASRQRASGEAAETGLRQRQVWESVRATQSQLTGSLGAQVRSAQSASSLQLALENEKLVALQRAYVDALKASGEAHGDIIGYVFAVNGRLNSADIYPSNGLFRKMWAKLLNASAIEAIGHKDGTPAAAPSMETVTAFLADAERGNASEKPLIAGVKLDSREGAQGYFFETSRASGFVHRNYLAK
jgi:hypothetical protein